MQTSRADADLDMIGIDFNVGDGAVDVGFALFDGESRDPVVIHIRVEGAASSPDLNAVAAVAWRRLAKIVQGWQEQVGVKSAPFGTRQG